MKRPYKPTETQIALHPPTEMIKCRCGVQFIARPHPLHKEDNPKLCLECNRKSWSRLWNENQPIEVRTEIAGVIAINRKERVK